MLTFGERVLCGNPLHQFGSRLEPHPDLTREFGLVANTNTGLNRNSDTAFLTVNGPISMTRCQRNQYTKHSLLSEGQLQDFQNILKYLLSELSSLNLVSSPKSD